MEVPGSLWRKFRKRLWLTIFGIFVVTVVVCSGMLIGMYQAVKREISEMKIENLALNNNGFGEAVLDSSDVFKDGDL